MRDHGLAGQRADPSSPRRGTTQASAARRIRGPAAGTVGIGNNINQIAHWANAKKSIQEAEIRQAVLLAYKAWELVKETL